MKKEVRKYIEKGVCVYYLGLFLYCPLHYSYKQYRSIDLMKKFECQYTENQQTDFTGFIDAPVFSVSGDTIYSGDTVPFYVCS